MVLKSRRFSDSQRLQAAANNAPPLRKGERSEAVARLQSALIDNGFRMPISTFNGTRTPDGVYGDETVQTVGRFQLREHLSNDGIAGRDTLSRLDAIFATKEPAAEPLPVVQHGDFAVTTARKSLSHLI